MAQAVRDPLRVACGIWPVECELSDDKTHSTSHTPPRYIFAVVNRIFSNDRIWINVNPIRIAPMTHAAAVA